ncbi:MAG: hypothetical protein WC007_01045 [Pelobacteraceae bacterium]
MMLMVSPAQGMIYMWKDPAGIAHYVNKEYDVPDRYKAKAKALYPEAADAGTAQPNSANAQTQAVTPPKAPERKSRRQRVRRADDE